LPAEEERTEIFRIHLTRRGRHPEDFDLKVLGAASEHFSGAEIEEAIISALYDAFYAQHDLTMDDILQAMRQTVPLSRTMDEHLNRLRSWAEGRARPASAPRVLSPSKDQRRMEF
jgi:SpoVK/Ycf46/Vps4 family AAA+-type ATPase